MAGQFRKKPGGFYPELLRGLDAFAFTNASVRLGQVEADRVILAPNVNAEDIIEGDRGSVHFRLEPLVRRGDTWTLMGAIDDTTAHLRFPVGSPGSGAGAVGGRTAGPEDAPASR